MPKRRLPADAPQQEKMLVAILNSLADFAILEAQRWYRVPVESAPRRWPPDWMAWYHTKVFGPEAYAIHYYGKVREIRTVQRAELFPNELASARAHRAYYQVHIESLERRDPPIRSAKPRRLVFVATTLEKFQQATVLNDLFDDSPLEDQVWDKLKQLNIPAERQWEVSAGGRVYQLDFAIFCDKGQIDVEADGDTYHTQRDHIRRDNDRNNALTSQNWRVLRFNGRQIREPRARYVTQITDTINRLGGLAEGLAPRRFHSLPDGPAQQLSLFDADPDPEA